MSGPAPAPGGPQPIDPRRHRPWALYGLLAICLLAYVLSEVVRHSGQTWPAVDEWGVAVFEIVASLLCMAKGLVDRRARAVPIAFGLALLLWSLGDLVLALQSVRGVAPPSPSLADAFYLAFYPTIYVALMLLVRYQVRRFGLATWLDGAIAGLGAAALCAAFAMHGLLHSVGGSTASVAVNLAYPIGDLMLLTMVVGGTAVLPGRRKLQWLLLATGCAINAVGDTFNLFQTGIGASDVGSALNAVAWPSSILLISGSMWLTPRRPHFPAHERPPGFVLPALAITGSLSILFVGCLHHLTPAALVLAAAALVLTGIRFWLSMASLRSLTEERHHQAITDQLTTLGNRRALVELIDALDAEALVADGGARDLTFLFVDLNHFKEINDTFGHSTGDELLRQLAQRLQESLRDEDLLVRLGGDEFAVALTDADADHGAVVAQRIANNLKAPFALGPVRARVSASIGIAVMPTDAADAHELLRCADLAMYRAKHEQKPFVIYQAEIDGRGNRLGLVQELRVAIEERQLELHYQPQVDVSTNAVVALEALVRWPHPRLGYIPPLEFLPLAEDAGLMDALTALVLEEALRQCSEWRRESESMTVSVNVSSTNLLDPGFAASVAALLERFALPPDALVLEITETTAIADFERCKLAIEALRRLGVVVSVDDFGAGFTSLAYLGSLAVGELKLDRSFITGIAVASEGRNRALVRSTIDLAHAIGLRVVAEGVEDWDSFDLLADLGCDLAQGYVISKPKPAGELGLGVERRPVAVSGERTPVSAERTPVTGECPPGRAPSSVRAAWPLPAGS